LAEFLGEVLTPVTGRKQLESEFRQSFARRFPDYRSKAIADGALFR
jgi:hypothetical protein